MNKTSIRSLLLSSDRAVERAMLALTLQGNEESSRRYYANWIKSGKSLSGTHLSKARELALSHLEELVKIASDNGASQECSLTMNRRGTFRVETYGDSHCGTTNPLEVQYHALIVCGAKTDRRGFLFDQLMVQGYFDTIKRTSLSCELLAMQSTKGLVSRIRKENPGVKLHKVELTLSPAPFLASMTYSWVP